MLYDHTWLETAEGKAGVVPAGDIMTIREMTDTDVDYATAVVAEEGWLGETRSVFEGFLEKDPGGCFIADHDERPVGMCIATTYRPPPMTCRLFFDSTKSALVPIERFFLERRLRLFARLCCVVEDDGKVAGYIMAQPGRGVMSVGPWLACGEEDARKLIETLALKSTGDPLRVGILESNSRAVGLARSFESFQEQTPCWRMVRGDGEGLGHHADLYGIGSAAKG